MARPPTAALLGGSAPPSARHPAIATTPCLSHTPTPAPATGLSAAAAAPTSLVDALHALDAPSLDLLCAHLRHDAHAVRAARTACRTLRDAFDGCVRRAHFTVCPADRRRWASEGQLSTPLVRWRRCSGLTITLALDGEADGNVCDSAITRVEPGAWGGGGGGGAYSCLNLAGLWVLPLVSTSPAAAAPAGAGAATAAAATGTAAGGAAASAGGSSAGGALSTAGTEGRPTAPHPLAHVRRLVLRTSDWWASYDPPNVHDYLPLVCDRLPGLACLDLTALTEGWPGDAARQAAVYASLASSCPGLCQLALPHCSAVEGLAAAAEAGEVAWAARLTRPEVPRLRAGDGGGAVAGLVGGSREEAGGGETARDAKQAGVGSKGGAGSGGGAGGGAPGGLAVSLTRLAVCRQPRDHDRYLTWRTAAAVAALRRLEALTLCDVEDAMDVGGPGAAGGAGIGGAGAGAGAGSGGTGSWEVRRGTGCSATQHLLATLPPTVEVVRLARVGFGRSGTGLGAGLGAGAAAAPDAEVRSGGAGAAHPQLPPAVELRLTGGLVSAVRVWWRCGRGEAPEAAGVDRAVGEGSAAEARAHAGAARLGSLGALAALLLGSGRLAPQLELLAIDWLGGPPVDWWEETCLDGDMVSGGRVAATGGRARCEGRLHAVVVGETSNRVVEPAAMARQGPLQALLASSRAGLRYGQQLQEVLQLCERVVEVCEE
ncbi:hypothetical protein HYH02_003124 [Chlamydomonas schloesseri]|uniref:Uncharacterized protein n=1 Tax=Chlamydomonas schloesseri TaxID=2026947 RepID=A0A835WRM7_9CHLO|nr:hypothetical protein HYH02_003124 [Chlamydomonas schloesseri]|eukprot:KAG2452088.1 hypothetical protein HYH02_003124 [Chlamydomonas schloesseri]